jgi:flagellar hook-associated protein FlgK
MNTLSSIARSGMAAAQLSLDSSAHNIANQATPAFRRQRVEQAALPDGGVEARVSQAEQPGQDLASDLVQQKVSLYAFKANARVLETQDALLGSLLDTRA